MAQKILIISAHPDDETIGMGGTIRKHTKRGDHVYWLILTEARAPRWGDDYRKKKAKEVQKVAAFFGFKKTIEAHFPAMELNTIPTADLSEAISRVVREVSPSVVYCPPANDINTDHALAYEATQVATRPIASSVMEVLAYEIPTTTRFCDERSFFVPNCYVDISTELKDKLRAFALFRTENRPFPHPRSPKGLEISACERGLALGVASAEAFRIVKSLR